MNLDEEIARCEKCLLIPGDYDHNPNFRSPRLDRAVEEGRESWYVPNGTITMFGMVLPLTSEYFPCDAHLERLKVAA